MPAIPRKRKRYATQAELHSAQEQDRQLTQEIPEDLAPQ